MTVNPSSDQAPGDPDDRQSRYIEAAAVNGALVVSLCAPNGIDYPLSWMRRLQKHATELHAAGVRDAGLRIDHLLLSANALNALLRLYRQ